MKRVLRTIFFFLLAVFAVVPAWAGGGKTVVKLFTSQGCSSCPPADALLAELARRDDVIALSFHVDYWNYIGWTDPFSFPAATARQRAYGRALGKSYVYTPQIVVDGRAETVGSNRREVANLIKMAAAATKNAVGIDHNPDGTARLRLPASASAVRAEIWLGFYDSRHTTAVERGENRGETIENANVVRVFRRISAWNGEAVDRTVDLTALGASGHDGCVVIVQAVANGPILAARAFPLIGH